MENNPFMFQTTNQLWFMLNIPNKTGGFVHQRNHITGHHLGQVATKNWGIYGRPAPSPASTNPYASQIHQSTINMVVNSGEWMVNNG